MGDEQQNALKFLDSCLYPFPGGNVQVVGRLVQDEKIDLLIHQHAQPEAGLFTAGEIAHGLEYILTLEHKCAQTVTRDLWGAILFIEHGVIQAALRVIEMNDLRQIAPFYCGTKLDLSGAILLTQQALDECGFAGSIISQQRDPLPCLHIQINIRKEDLVSECLGDIFHFEHHIAGKLLLAEGSPHGLFRLWLFGLLDALHTVLDGHGPAVKGAVIDAPALHAFHGKSKLLQLRLLLLILLELAVKALLLFL